MADLNRRYREDGPRPKRRREYEDDSVDEPVRKKKQRQRRKRQTDRAASTMFLIGGIAVGVFVLLAVIGLVAWRLSVGPSAPVPPVDSNQAGDTGNGRGNTVTKAEAEAYLIKVSAAVAKLRDAGKNISAAVKKSPNVYQQELKKAQAALSFGRAEIGTWQLPNSPSAWKLHSAFQEFLPAFDAWLQLGAQLKTLQESGQKMTDQLRVSGPRINDDFSAKTQQLDAAITQYAAEYKLPLSR